jgi:mannose-1-phosphate guanylyltransferase
VEIGGVVFGAGRGKRLRPLTDLLPKPALPILDLPLGAWALRELTGSVPPVVVNGSHLADGLVAAFEALGLPGWEAVVESPEAFGTAGTLRALRERIGERVVTCNGDLITSLRVADLLATHFEVGAPATVAVRVVDENADLEVREGKVTRFIDRRRVNQAGARFLGMAVFERSALALLPELSPAGLGETLLRDLAERGELAAYVFDGYWRDVGTVDQYLAAALDVLYGRAPAAPVPLTGRIVEVEGGLAYLGPRASAAPGSLRSGAIVLEGATVAAGASLEKAIVWPGASVPRGTTLESQVFTGT